MLGVRLDSAQAGEPPRARLSVCSHTSGGPAQCRQAPTVQCATVRAFRLAGPFGSRIVSGLQDRVCYSIKTARRNLAEPLAFIDTFKPVLLRTTAAAAITSKRLYPLHQNLLESLSKAIILTSKINFFEPSANFLPFIGFKGFDFLARFTAEWKPQKNWNHIKEGQNETRGCAGQRVSMLLPDRD